MSKLYDIIDKSDFMDCYKCDGFGYTRTELKCPTCNGFGVWKESHYIIIDKKTNFAFDSDNIG